MKRIIVMAIMVAMVGSGCTSMNADRQTALGAAIGTGVGMVLGNNLGSGHDDRALGGVAGGLLGGYLARQGAVQKQQADEQAAQLRALQTQANTVTVWIDNDNGSRTPVTLVKTADGQYIGPNGEYYMGMPTQAQLKPVYGI